MRLTNSEETYGLVHQILHWTTAGLILFLIPLGLFMHELPNTNQLEIDFKVWMYGLHKSVGIAALFIALARIAWALMQPHPRQLNEGMEALAARTVHILLYALIIAVPVLGWLHHASSTGYAPLWWGFGDTLPGVPKSETVTQFFATAHWLAAVGLVLTLVLHIAGAVKHAVKDKDHTLARMVPGAYVETGLLPERTEKDASAVFLAGGALALGLVAVFVVHNLRGTAPVQVAQANAPAVASATATETAGNWAIDYGASKLAVTVKQMGADVEGRFGQWQADVTFDPANPEATTIDAVIQTGSFDFGANTAQAISADFLNADAFPEATYKAEGATKTDTGFRTEGTLTLAGMEQKVPLDFTFEERDGRAYVTATATVTRLDFGIGKGYPDAGTVGLETVVTITIEAQKSGAAPAS